LLLLLLLLLLLMLMLLLLLLMLMLLLLVVVANRRRKVRNSGYGCKKEAPIHQGTEGYGAAACAPHSPARP